MNRRSLRLLPLVAALLLPSCVRWHLGAAIRDAAETRIGVDVEHPVDGKCYVVKRKGQVRKEVYVYAPEVRYHRCTPWIELDDAPGEPPHARPAVRLRPTGRVVPARMSWELNVPRGLEHKMLPRFLPRPVFREEVPALPLGARPLPMPTPLAPRFVIRRLQPVAQPLSAVESAFARLPENQGPSPGRTPPAPTVDTLGTQEHRRSYVATALAAPFDYLLDPVLSGLSTALFWTGGAVVGTVYAVAAQGQQQQQPAPAGLFEGELNPAAPTAPAPRNTSARP